MKVLAIFGIAIGGLILLFAAGLAVLAAMDDLNAFKPMVAGRVGEKLGRTLTIDGDLEVDWSLPPAIRAGSVRLADDGRADAADLITVERIVLLPDWSALLRGKVAIAEASLHGARANLSRNAEGQWNLPRVDRTGTDRSGAPGPLPTVHVTDSLVQLHVADKAQELRVERLTLAFGAAGEPVRASGRFRYRSVSVSAEASAAALKDRQGRRLNAVIEIGPNRLTVQGDLASLRMPPKGDLRFTLKAPEPGVVLPAERLPSGLDEPLTAEGRLHRTGNDGRYRVSDLHVAAGPNDASGWIELAPLAEPVHLSAELTARHLDLGPYLVDERRDERRAAQDDGNASDRVFAAEPLAVALPAGVTAEADIKIQTLLLPFLKLDDLETRLKLQDGRMVLEPLTASVAGGRLDAQFHLAAGGRPVPDFRAQGEVRRLDLADLLAPLGPDPALRGEIGAQFDLAGRGRSPAELAGSVDGRFSLAMQDGRLARRLLRKTEAYSFELTDAFVKMLRPKQTPQGDYARIECAVCRFDLQDGVAESNVLVFDTAQAGIVGNGSIDLESERFDIALKPVTDGGIGIPGLVKLKVGTTVADAFKLGGTFKAPVIRLDKSESAVSLGKAIGGMLLFGPAGLTAGLLEAEFGSGNPCVRALRQADMLEKR